MRARVTKKVRIDAAHYLPDYEGVCSKVHGHSFYLETRVEGPIDIRTGMVVDFALLKKVFNQLDHTTINEVISMPTAENIATFFLGKLEEIVSSEARVEYVKVWETPDSCAEVRGNEKG